MSDNDKIKAEIAAKKLRLQELKDKRARGPAPPPAADGGAPKEVGRGPPPPPLVGGRGLINQITELVGAKVKLATSVGLASHTIPPLERHVYDKGCQTEFGVALKGKEADMEKALRAEQEALMQKEAKLKVLEDQLKIDKAKYDVVRQEERMQERKELSAEEQKRIMSSGSFQQFFGKATRVVERALSQSIYDITTDYASNAQERNTSRGQGLASRVVFQDKRVQNRAVTSLDWSHKYPELLIASYAAQDDPMSLDPHGTVFVWNMHMPNRPEYVFTCNSAVLAAKFHPSQPHLILGACQSGQIVIWDTREKTTPVNRTNLSQGHTHPVYALELVSVVNKLHNIVSMSTDGHLCVWSDNNLHQHSKEVRMKHGKEEITTTSFAFPKSSQNSLIMGSDEGWLYKGHVYDNEGIYDAFQAHKAPITSVQYHPSQKSNNLSEYFLTASFDWTVKLWSNKMNRPLLTFESARDYVLDVQWSPVHPALFAMGDGTGRLDIWNISGDSDVPALTTHVDPSPGGERAAISRISWSENGSQIAAGTSLGAVHVFVLREDLVIPNTDDASQIIERLQKKQTE